MALGTRAIARIQGSGNGGFAGAKKLADLYAATNTGDGGEVKDPAVYDKIINEILAPYAGTLDGQNLIADYTNKKKKLTLEKSESETTLAAIKQKEYSAWYVNDDGEDNTSFRNPAWVAQVTSDSLEMILAETLELRDQRAAENKDTAEFDRYIEDLSRRSARMRSVATKLEDGNAGDLDGYGYYVDADPNTGVIRGASFMPTDLPFQELANNTVRTDAMVNMNGTKVPVYLPFVKAEDGSKKAMFGGVEYIGDSNSPIIEGGGGEVTFADRSRYQHSVGSIEMNKIYSTFTGKTNVDGSFKKDYLYVSPDNKVYRFSEDDPKGKELMNSMRDIAGVTEVQKINPADVRDFYTEPLPDDSTPLVRSATHTAKMTKFAQEQAVYDAEVERLKNQSSLGAVAEFAPGVVKNAFSSVVGGVKSFFGRKNKQNVPDQPTASINGQTSANEVVAQGAGFFRNKV